MDYLNQINTATTLAQLNDVRYGANGFETAYFSGLITYDSYLILYNAYVVKYYSFRSIASIIGFTAPGEVLPGTDILTSVKVKNVGSAPWYVYAWFSVLYGKTNEWVQLGGIPSYVYLDIGQSADFTPYNPIAIPSWYAAGDWIKIHVDAYGAPLSGGVWSKDNQQDLVVYATLPVKPTITKTARISLVAIPSGETFWLEMSLIRDDWSATVTSSTYFTSTGVEQIVRLPVVFETSGYYSRAYLMAKFGEHSFGVKSFPSGAVTV